MEVQGISRQALQINQIVRAQNISGRIALPVSSNNLYVSFKHITGIAAPKTIPAFSLSQLRRLDNLIDKLKNMNGEEVVNLNLGQLNTSDISSKINELSARLHKKLNEDNLYKTKVESSGILVDLVA